MKLKQEFVALDSSKHLIKNFDCTKKTMNDFLVKFAIKHAKQGISTTMVLTVDDPSLQKLPVVAYYTLGISSIYRDEIPSSSLPTYPIPLTLLARLAIDVHYQQQSLGRKSLIYALRHVVKLNDLGLKTHGLMLDVLDDEALSFYKKFNFFQEFPGNPMKLFVSMQELRKI
ncbi:MAG: GNAT family N-acetyltransferase [Legionella sp.]|uniref:GNAT family N-acetyltransferase n=1 Tax=Legionella sp. TaxID=459 RepID=UPI00283D3C6A|nr:GNAT family N-acetyltransferase [Legionella sp.]